ncbi:STAS domain-containing protein [Streptacidiphilus fuscans]|uniref:Anti-sigma factor antagonist n=1 Tax=Streptacidiphilus fuscans TaxID=2789292 RepID=A0A931FH96_9ACTN|nr:STAS domain-containing protein [Streptacidiphilus fuscans]MBF9072140.1 STAS domain-containing protein [Streptacidiphilus fuscans]MBF9072951.1 STAS domain-containing protein [Streptacidiphilus fuscans]
MTTNVTVERYEQDDWVLLSVSGDLDLGSGGRVREAVREAVANGSRKLVVDLTDVRFCDSTGVGVLIAARRLMRSCGGELRLVMPRVDPASGAVPSQVHRVFAALGVRRLFTVSDERPF